jgi:hypothetical protein
MLAGVTLAAVSACWVGTWTTWYAWCVLRGLTIDASTAAPVVAMAMTLPPLAVMGDLPWTHADARAYWVVAMGLWAVCATAALSSPGAGGQVWLSGATGLAATAFQVRKLGQGNLPPMQPGGAAANFVGTVLFLVDVCIALVLFADLSAAAIYACLHVASGLVAHVPPRHPTATLANAATGAAMALVAANSYSAGLGIVAFLWEDCDVTPEWLWVLWHVGRAHWGVGLEPAWPARSAALPPVPVPAPGPDCCVCWGPVAAADAVVCAVCLHTALHPQSFACGSCRASWCALRAVCPLCMTPGWPARAVVVGDGPPSGPPSGPS